MSAQLKLSVVWGYCGKMGIKEKMAAALGWRDEGSVVSVGTMTMQKCGYLDMCVSFSPCWSDLGRSVRCPLAQKVKNSN